MTYVLIKAVSTTFMTHVGKIPAPHEQTNNKLIIMKQLKAHLDILLKPVIVTF